MAVGFPDHGRRGRALQLGIWCCQAPEGSAPAPPCPPGLGAGLVPPLPSTAPGDSEPPLLGLAAGAGAGGYWWLVVTTRFQSAFKWEKLGKGEMEDDKGTKIVK